LISNTNDQYFTSLLWLIILLTYTHCRLYTFSFTQRTPLHWFTH